VQGLLLVGVLCWALSPLRAEVVCWASALPYSLAGLLSSAALVLSLSSEKIWAAHWAWLVSIASAAAAALSKSAAAPLPVALLLLRHFALRMAGGSRPMRPSYVFVNAVLHVLPHTGLALVAVACQLHALPPTGKGWLWFWPPVVSWPALQRAGCSVFSHAVAAFPHPQPMLFYPEPWQGLGVFAGGWRAGVVIAITTAACAVWLQTALRLKPFQTQGSKALVALAVLWLASISHFLPGAIIPSPHAEPSLGGDRYAYLPSLFLALVPATAYLAGRSCWFPGHTRIGGGPLRALMLVVAVAAPVRMVARSASAARAWKSSESLMETALLQFQPLAEEFLAHRDQTRWQGEPGPGESLALDRVLWNGQ